jgi:hypothetical protein
MLRLERDSQHMRIARLSICSGVALIAIVAAGCGSSGSATPAAATPAAATTSTPTPTPNAGAPNSAAFQKFSACLKKHGVTIGAFGRRPGSGTRPPGGTRPSGSGTGTGGAPATGNRPRRAQNPKFQAAMKACQSLAPQGFGQGFGGRFGQGGGGGGANNQQFQKFTACMKSHGVTLPTGGQQAAKPINRNSAVYKKASAACSKLLPGPGGSGAQSS